MVSFAVNGLQNTLSVTNDCFSLCSSRLRTVGRSRRWFVTCCGIVKIEILTYTNRRQEQETNNKIQAQDTSLHEAIFEQASSFSSQEIGKASRLCVAPSVLALVLVVLSPLLSLREHTGWNKAGEERTRQADARLRPTTLAEHGPLDTPAAPFPINFHQLSS